MAEKAQVITNEHGGKPKESFGKKTGRVCKKWWWLFLIILIVVVLVVVLPIIYVAYPKIARDSINDSTIELTKMEILQPRAQSVDLVFNQTFHTDSSRKAKLDAFKADLYINDEENSFASIEVPAVEGKNGATSYLEQTVNITDLSEFTKYVATVLSSEEYSLRLKGKGGLKLGSLPSTTVNYDKDIKLKGFNRLEGFGLTKFYLLNETLENGINAFGTVKIPNPTIMTLQLGTVKLDMFCNNTAVGNATLSNVMLTPGDNFIDLDATVYQLVVVGLVLGGAADKQGNLQIVTNGNATIYDGEVVPYYTNALAATNLTFPLNVYTAQNKTAGGEARSLQLSAVL